ncbi:MAG: thiamine-phosphate kinase [Flavobacteriales bacterium]|nr:thiamine-phosphate kinase [Flavobacteriales bacterium]
MLQDKNEYKTPISKLGEFKLIEHLTQNFKIKHSESIYSIGDDSAVIKSSKNTVISTDTLTEAIHFDLAYFPLKHLGYKAVVVGLSDIIAMNAVPKQIMISIAVSNRFPVEALEDIYSGIHVACEKYNVDLIGGDTTASKLGLVITVTSIGEVDEKEIVYRKGANPTDLLVTTGDLGGAFMGLKVLQRENVTFQSNPNFQPDLSGYEYIVQKQLKPELRVDIQKIFSELEVKPTAMIDISDGLSSELLHLSKQSNVGFNLYEEKLPIDNQTITVADEFNLNPSTAVLNGGEDYELLFTLPMSDYEKIRNHLDFTVIGHATENSGANYLVARGSSQLIPITAQGWTNEKNESDNLEN